MKYLLTQIHFAIYLSTLFVSHFYLQQGVYLCILSFGWGFYGLTTIGHDCVHYSFHANKKVNEIFSFLCLDCLVITTSKWRYTHNELHHKNLKGEGDIMFLQGNYMLEEIVRLILGYAKHKEERSLLKYLYRIPFFVMLFQHNLFSIIGIYIVYFWCIGFFGYITHSNSTLCENSDRNSIEYKLNNSLDIYPKSHLVNLISGGTNGHGTHHIYPYITRYESMTYCDKLQKYKEYRRIDTLFELFLLYKNRNKPYEKE